MREVHRRLFFLGGAEPIEALFQNLATSLAFLLTMVAAWRLASAVARLRPDPAAALAALNHMLKNGFFFIQGLFKIISSLREIRTAAKHCSGDDSTAIGIEACHAAVQARRRSARRAHGWTVPITCLGAGLVRVVPPQALLYFYCPRNRAFKILIRLVNMQSWQLTLKTHRLSRC